MIEFAGTLATLTDVGAMVVETSEAKQVLLIRFDSEIFSVGKMNRMEDASERQRSLSLTFGLTIVPFLHTTPCWFDSCLIHRHLIHQILVGLNMLKLFFSLDSSVGTPMP